MSADPDVLRGLTYALESRLASTLNIATRHEVERPKAWFTHDELGVLLDALRASRSGGAAASGWKPIETAPKDGSEFLAACDRVADGFQQVVFWDDDVAHPGWGTKDSDAICPFEFFTHWRPLPPPPEHDTEETRDV